MERTKEQKQEWEQWLLERPENVRKVAKKIVPWKKYIDIKNEDIGNRYSPISYDEHKNGNVTITCEKINEEMPFLGICNVFGMNPDNLQEDKK